MPKAQPCYLFVCSEFDTRRLCVCVCVLYMGQRCTDYWRLVALATEYFTVATNDVKHKPSSCSPLNTKMCIGAHAQSCKPQITVRLTGRWLWNSATILASKIKFVNLWYGKVFFLHSLGCLLTLHFTLLRPLCVSVVWNCIQSTNVEKPKSVQGKFAVLFCVLSFPTLTIAVRMHRYV